MSRFTNPRRWSALERRRGAALQTEHSVTPEEARVAIYACLMGQGLIFERVQGYDPKLDRYVITCRDPEGLFQDVGIEGELVAKTVRAARTMCGQQILRRPSEYAKPPAR